MEIGSEKREDVLVVSTTGRIDTNTSGELEARILEWVDAGESRVVVDLAGVEYISSAGLRVLLVAAKKLQAGAGKLALCGMRPGVRQVFELAGFLAIFSVEDDVDAAVAKVSA